MLQCQSCSTENQDSSKFCSECGSALKPEYEVTETLENRSPPSGNASSDPSVHGRFLPGTYVTNRYRIVSLLGTGGMGEVYRADDLKLGQTVALKFLPHEVADDPKRLAYFHNEVRLTRQISHPNVCRVYDIGEVDGLHFLSMEFIDGEDLKSLLRRIGRLPKDKGIQIARQLLAGLAAAHEKGVLHRDLKPANLMIDGRGHARITDFGLARLLQRPDPTEGPVGTPAYMAPEQLAAQESSVQSDLYALGLTLYEVFAGVLPRRSQSGTPGTQNENVATKPLSDVVENVDPGLDRIILSCLEPDPDLRPRSAALMAASLPGSNPLAAALAAGETPSPELVASAGGTIGLRPRPAVTCLVGIVICLTLVSVLGEQVNIVNRFQVRPTDVLFDAAAKALVCLDQPPSGKSFEVGGFVFTNDAISPVRYWYRRRQRPLVVEEFKSLAFQPRAAFGRVELKRPAWGDPGEVGVQLNPQGELLWFRAIPNRLAESSGSAAEDPLQTAQRWRNWVPNPAVNWDDASLKKISYDDARKLELPIPPDPFDKDTYVAWESQNTPAASGSVYVVAATYGGRPTYFHTYVQPPKDTRWAITGKPMYDFVWLALWPVMFGLAWHNLRRGRVDRRILFRASTYILLITVLTWVLFADHAMSHLENDLLELGVASSLFYVGFFALWYSAIEPFMRRTWPQSLITWTRLWHGRFRDPLIGRDLLIGTLVGTLSVLASQLGNIVPVWFQGGLPFPRSSLPETLEPMGVVNTILDLQILGLVICCFIIAILALGRILFRSQAAAIFCYVMFTVFALLPPIGEHSLLHVVSVAVGVAVGWTLISVLFMRLGMLSIVVAWFCQGILAFLPLTTDFDAEYFQSAMIGLGLILTLAVFGFLTTTSTWRMSRNLV